MIFCPERLGDFFCPERFLSLSLGLGFVANQPTVHSGVISRGRVCGCGCWR